MLNNSTPENGEFPVEKSISQDVLNSIEELLTALGFEEETFEEEIQRELDKAIGIVSYQAAADAALSDREKKLAKEILREFLRKSLLLKMQASNALQKVVLTDVGKTLPVEQFFSIDYIRVLLCDYYASICIGMQVERKWSTSYDESKN